MPSARPATAGTPAGAMRFRHRRDGGRALASALFRFAGRGDVVVLAIPRRGVPVAYEVARALRVPLDVFLVRKLAVPDAEVPMGAVASGGVALLDERVAGALAIPRAVVVAVVAAEARELQLCEIAWRGERPAASVRGRTALLVDDAIVTGATMREAVAALRRLEPARIVAAAPAGVAGACRALACDADDVVCAVRTEPADDMSAWYEGLAQTTDDEVRELLGLAETDRRAWEGSAP